MAKHYLEMTTEEREYALDCAQTFLKWTREDIKDVTKSFFKIGFRLYEARAYKYYEALGYADIETLAEEEFGFKRSTTYGLIQVYEKTCSKYGHNSMDEKYIGYDYSKLLELCKPRYGGDGILKRIKPTDSVRDIRKYVKFWNEYSQKHSGCPSITLQEWKAQQEIENVPALPSISSNKQIKRQFSIEEAELEEIQETPKLVPMPGTQGNWGERHFSNTEETPPAPVQTSGLPTCAKTELTIEPEKPKYNFATRAGVREFLADYLNWEWFKSPTSCFFLRVWTYTFKNGAYIYACERHIYQEAKLQLGKAESQIMYFLNAWSNDGIAEISKGQFEQYCAEHKNEL